MVTWRLTMKLFSAKCHERATLRKLWCQTGNKSLLPAKCWPLLHVIAGISARFSNFAFVLFCYRTNHLMTGPSSLNVFPSTSSRETLRLSGNKIHCSPRDQSLSVKYHRLAFHGLYCDKSRFVIALNMALWWHLPSCYRSEAISGLLSKTEC